MSDKKKIVVEKTCLLQDIWDESTRLQPLMLTLIDDLETLTQQTIFLGHFIDRLVLKNSSRNFFLLSFGTNEQHFYRHDQIKSNTKVQILNEHDFQLSDTAVAFESKLISLAPIDSSNVLIINCINPLFLIFDNDGNDDDDRGIVRKFYQFLQRLKKNYQQIILIYHSMFDLSIEDVNETSVLYMSNVIIDFRLNNMNKSFKQCLNIFDKDDNHSKKTIHCHVITKKKHPRTHLQYDQKHEHIEIDTNLTVKFISQDNLLKQEKLNNDNDSTQLPQSSFRLTLTKQEEEARENLVLPYIK